MVHIDVHRVFELVCRFILHCLCLALVGALRAILLSRVEPDEFGDEGVVGVVVELVVDPLAGGRGRELLHEDVPMVKIGVDAAIGVA